VSQFLHAIGWIFTASNWSHVQLGSGIGGQLGYHVELSAISLGLAAAVAVPLGMAVGHTRRGQFATVSITNIGRAIPSFALLVLAFIVVSNLRPSLGFSMLPTLIALVVLAIPPILINTYVGVEGVDPSTVEAARGMGLSPRQVLVEIEVPLAAPLIMAGLRTSAVAVVATATLAGFAGGGGLGVFLYLGFAQPGQEQILIGGAILVAVLAILTDVVFALLERVVTPKTRSSRKKVVAAPLPVAAAAAQT
jgi:osmoprotectant transport system permease protein